MGGQDWETEQRARVAKAMLAGEPPHRDFRVQVAADCRLEEAFFAELLETFENHCVWSHLPSMSQTQTERAWAFRVLSRLGATVMQGVGQPHQCYPTKLFSLLSHPEQSQELAGEPLCLKDTWTAQLQAQYPDFLSEDFVNILRVQASLQMVDIAGIEAKHASIRRQVTLRSVQTWPLSFSRTSAEWLLQNVRRSLSSAPALKAGRRLTVKVASIQSSDIHPPGASNRALAPCPPPDRPASVLGKDSVVSGKSQGPGRPPHSR